MKSTQTKTLIASSPTHDGIIAAAKRFFCGSEITLVPQDTVGVWWVWTGKGRTSLIVRLTRGRYRLEMPR